MMSLFYCSDNNLCFQLIMPGGNCAVYECSSSKATPRVTLYRSNTGGTFLQPLLMVGWVKTIWKVELKTKNSLDTHWLIFLHSFIEFFYWFFYTGFYYWIFFHAVKILIPTPCSRDRITIKVQLGKCSLIVENISTKFIIELHIQVLGV